MKTTFLFCLLLTIGLTGCLFKSDVNLPPKNRSVLKGPLLETLPEQSVSVLQTRQLPFSGNVKQFGARYLLEGYNTPPARLAVIDNETITDLPVRRFGETFLDTQGNAWRLATAQNAADTLYQLQGSQWSRYSLLTSENYYGYVVNIRDNEFVLDSHEGIVIWDVSAKVRKALVAKNKAWKFTPTFMIGFDGGTVLIHDRNTQQLLHAIPAGYSLWDAHEDAQQRLWVVVRDKNWDGLLYRYDGKTSQFLTTVPVGHYDSGRAVGQSIVDKAGNFWIQVEGHYVAYTPMGRWIKPLLPVPQDNSNLAHMFVDDQRNLITTDSKRLFTIRL